MSGIVPEEKDVTVVYTAKLSDGYVASFERSFDQKGYDKEKIATVVSYNGCYTIMPLNLSKEYLSLIFHCGDTILFLIAGIEIVFGVCLTIRRKETEDDY